MLKKVMFFIFLFIFVLSKNFFAIAESVTAEKNLQAVSFAFEIIPEPKQLEVLEGAPLEFGSLIELELSGGAKRPVMPFLLSHLPLETDKKGTVLLLELVKDDSVPKSQEGYTLNICSNSVRIASKGQAGLFYGCQTLNQILEDTRDTGTVIPACRIIDYPNLKYRAVHFDVKNHLDRMQYYYQSIDHLAKYKINAIIFEFEDKLKYRRQPTIAAPQAISIEEMKAFTKYAKERNIEVTPLVQGLGHAGFILKHEKYKDLREDPNNFWAFCPLHEGTYQVLYDMYLDAIEATPGSRYLHIGGDEVRHIGTCPRCKEIAEKKGITALNQYWLNRVCDFIRKQGRIPIIWDDMLWKYAEVYDTTHTVDMNEDLVEKKWKNAKPKLDELADNLPVNSIYMRWNYERPKTYGNELALNWYEKNDRTAWVATAAQTNVTLYPRSELSGHIKNFLQLANKHVIEGVLCTAWDDSSPHMETYWRGWIASAEYSWAPKGKTLPEYEKAFLHREFGPECVWATNVHKRLSTIVEFWRKALALDQTRRKQAVKSWKKGLLTDGTEKLLGVLDVPDVNLPGQWSKKFGKRLNEARQVVDSHRKLQYDLDRLLSRARRNRYHVEMLSAINDFAVSTAQLLLALEQTDTISRVQQKEGIVAVMKAIKEFDLVWMNLKRVYSKTRFIGNPQGYVKDVYQHIATMRLDETWLIMFEQEYHKKVQQYLENLQNHKE
jgi:hypothetical protein